jgi:O-antigen/teichoic acid export membrane protein
MNTTRMAFARLANMLLRLGNLVTKLGLALYMGRYISLADMGIYGLVFGVVAIMVAVMGIRLDYAVSRDLVGADPEVALRKMRDEAIFYALNHGVLALIILILALTNTANLSGSILFYVFLLSVFESFANMTYINLNSLHQQLAANMLFFIRAGAWALPAIGLGLWNPFFRTVNTIFICWALGVFASLAGTLWVWRHMPWRRVLRTPIDWPWIFRDVRKCFFIWLGTIGISCGFYVDRFVVVRYLSLDYVGVGTFYFSFANALFSLIQSGVLVFSYPRLITFHKTGDKKAFRTETFRTHLQVFVLGGAIAAVIGGSVWFGCRFLDRPLLEQEITTLWMLLIGFWLRATAEVDYYVLFACHQDRPIWLGNLLFLIPAFGFNLLLVPLFGLIGIGYGSILSSLCLIAWRQYAIQTGSILKKSPK